MNQLEHEVYDEEREATPGEMRGVAWTVISLITVFGILVSLTVMIVL